MHHVARSLVPGPLRYFLPKTAKRVVVVGGGPTGLFCADRLRHHFEVTVVDGKDYFEFTPSILRAVADPAHHSHITFNYRDVLERQLGVEFVLGEATSIDATPEHASLGHTGAVRVMSGAGDNRLQFDYCVVAVGASNGLWKPRLAREPAPPAGTIAAMQMNSMKGHQSAAERTLDLRRQTLQDLRERIGSAKGAVVVGAGLVGSLCAVVLLRKGFAVHVFERYEDIRSIPSAGRSINLAITSRGLRAIRSLGGGVYDDIVGKLTTKIRGRIIHMPQGGDVLFQRYGKDDSECNYSVSRLDLNKFLIDLAAKEGAEYHFSHALSESSDFTGPEAIGCQLHFTRRAAGVEERVRVQLECPVIACDGAGSRVRYALRRSGLTTFTEELISRGYKEVLFPNPGDKDFGAPGGDGGEACEGRYGLHIWPRGDHMLMALVNLDGSFTGTIYMDNEGEESFATFADTPEGRAKCTAWCEKHYSDALPHVGGIDCMVKQIVTNPTGILGTVRTSTWAVQGKVVLIGDACHAMVPFFGQGCNCGFEDTLWLSRFLDEHCCAEGKCMPEKCTADNFAKAFAALESERKPNADAICDMALENFREMSDKTGDVRFQALKKVENKLENQFPDKIRSRYAMVCYGGEGNVSYANTKRLGVVQWEILEELCSGMVDDKALAKAAENVDLERAKALLEERLVPLHRELNIDLSTVRH
mmetsp:Transcript_95716/g.275826  ORF Transcript_95716/g.275826 Transcript_95716/m.275826 type:complete len:703 (+) Transcript_95716:58-2166(+)